MCPQSVAMMSPPAPRRPSEPRRQGLLGAARVGALVGLVALIVAPSALDAAPPQWSTIASSSAGMVGNAPSDAPALSADGHCVAFQSAASNLAANDTNGVVDVFVTDFVSAVPERVSLSSGGTQADGPSYEPAVSGNCRLVAFTSRASNLVAGDTNGVPDVFVHDRVTHLTTRVNAQPDGTQGVLPASSPGISGDGRFVVFDTAGDPSRGGAGVFVHDRGAGTTLAIVLPGNQRARQPAISADGRYVAVMSYASTSLPGDYYDDGVWLHDRATNATTRIASALGPDDPLIGRPAIDADGSTIAFAVTSPVGPGPLRTWAVKVFDRLTGETRPLAYQRMPGWPSRADLSCTAAPCGATSRPSLDAEGRQVGLSQYSGTTAYLFDLWVADRWLPTGVRVGEATAATTPFGANVREVSLSGDGRLVATAAGSPAQVYVQEIDIDHDAMPDHWERTMGLGIYGTPAEAVLDTDGDGVGNVDEYRQGTHPAGFYRNYLAEGATSDFFSTALSLVGSGPVLLTFQRSDGTTVREFRTLSSTDGPLLVTVADIAGMEHAEFSTLVESVTPVVVDRTITWDRSRYGAHAETAQAAPRATWHFAEGATHSGFDLFYLLQNPGSQPAVVEVTYLRPAPSAPIVKTYVVAPTSRRTLWVNQEDARLASTDVSAVVRSTNAVPILAERALYASRPGRMFSAGHAAAGITDLSSDWYFAEGATGAMLDEFITIANPGDTEAVVDVTYLLPDGATVTREHQVAASSRYTIWVDHDDPRLADTAVSAVVHARDGALLAAERVLWWPGPTAATWEEAHVVVGATRAWRAWAIADGYVDAATSMFVLIGNPSSDATTARVTLRWRGGSTSREYALAPTSRVNAWINNDFSVPPGTRFSVTIESAADVVVERATYWDANGQPWAAGTAAMAVPQPLVFTSESEFVAATGATHRASFDSMPPGAVTFPFALEGLTLDAITARPEVGTVWAPTPGDFPTGHLSVGMNVGAEHLRITMPPGTKAAGMWLTDSVHAASPLVAITHAAGGGASSELPFGSPPVFVGFASPTDIATVRIWTDWTGTMSGLPLGLHLQLGDILTKR